MYYSGNSLNIRWGACFAIAGGFVSVLACVILLGPL